MNYQNQAAPKGLKLVSAAGELILVIGEVVVPVSVGTLHVDHNFVVVHSLITPVILGTDFLHKHGIVLDFTTTPVTIQNTNPPPNIPIEAQSQQGIHELQTPVKILLIIVQFLYLMQ